MCYNPQMERPLATQDEVDRGREAENLLQNAVLREAWNALQDDLVRQWRLTEAGDTQGRERLWIASTLHDHLHSKLDEFVNAGRMASEEHDRQRKSKNE